MVSHANRKRNSILARARGCYSGSLEEEALEGVSRRGGLGDGAAHLSLRHGRLRGSRVRTATNALQTVGKMAAAAVGSLGRRASYPRVAGTERVRLRPQPARLRSEITR